MPKYSYQATDDRDQKVAGDVSAESVSQAIVTLESRGLSVESISIISAPTDPLPEAQGSPTSLLQHGSDRLNLEDHFHVAFDRRHAMVPALAALAEEMPLGKAKTEIRHLSDALQNAEFTADLRHSKIVTRWLPLLVTGFSHEGNAERVSDLVSHASQESENRRQRRRALAYPLFIMMLSISIFLGLCVVVVPTFNSMFEEFGMELPYPTQMVVFLSQSMQTNPILLFLSIGVLVTAIYGVFRAWTHFALTTRMFSHAVAGNSTNVTAMSSLTRQLAELLSIEVSLPDALWIAAHQCQHYHFKHAAMQLARDAHRGRVTESAAARHFPSNMIQALQTGPVGRPQIALLRELSTMYSDRVARRMDWSTGATAPIMLMIAGVMIGFFAVALFAPLVSLVSGLS